MEVTMEIKTNKLYYGGKLMPWGKSCVVKNPNGWIFLGGTEGINPDTKIRITPAEKHQPVDVLPDIESQAQLCFQKIKSALEDEGSSLNNIVKMWYYIVGDFPEGLAYSDTWLKICQVREEFFKEHAPQLCCDNTPPTFDLIGVKHLALPDMLIEIAVVAVF
jgi:enamine deaminase RidA (YjgF/YER057c/UK114 family)